MFYPNRLKKKSLIKVPKNVNIIYCSKKNIITFISPLQTKSIKIKIKIILLPLLNSIAITNIPVKNTSVNNFKKKQSLQGSLISKINQILIEITYTLYYKLNLVGVGYKAFPYKDSKNQIYFKLGYSHYIYFRVPRTLNVYSQKLTKLFIFGNCSYDQLTQTSGQIRLLKTPEPYKGKGILYNEEKIKLKKGKKI